MNSLTTTCVLILLQFFFKYTLENDFSAVPNINEGYPVTPEKQLIFGFQISFHLKTDNDQFVGCGAIVHRRVAVTTGSICKKYKPRDLMMQYGTISLKDPNRKKVHVDLCHIQSYKFYVAAIFGLSDFQFGPFVIPAKITPKPPPVGTDCFTSCWGSKVPKGPINDVLQYFKSVIIEKSICANDGSVQSVWHDEVNLCTEQKEKKGVLCEHDYGTTVVCEHELHGVINAWYKGDCVTLWLHLSVATKIHPISDWINEMTAIVMMKDKDEAEEEEYDDYTSDDKRKSGKNDNADQLLFLLGLVGLLSLLFLLCCSLLAIFFLYKRRSEAEESIGDTISTVSSMGG